jgi:hypothetical protein
LHPEVANKAVQGSTGAGGKGAAGGDISLVSGGRREVSVHTGKLDNLGSHLQAEAAQAGTTEIWVQINTSGVTQEQVIKMIQGKDGLRSAYPELRGKKVTIFGRDGKQWWSGEFK